MEYRTYGPVVRVTAAPPASGPGRLRSRPFVVPLAMYARDRLEEASDASSSEA
jgi:hypothetical protein